MAKLKLYSKDVCPFCKKVTQYMKRHDIKGVEIVDTADPKNHQELIEIGGMNQVPMLLIDDKPLYESNDIIQWFKDNM